MALPAGGGTDVPSDGMRRSSAAAQQHAKLPDLDLEELSPLPPAQGFAQPKSASEGRPSDQQHDAVFQHATAFDAATTSPALSAAPSSFRLEGSPPSSLDPADSPILTPSRNQRIHSNQSSSDNQQQPSQSKTQHKKHEHPRHYQESHRESTAAAAAAASARYVTVSAILSRSEMYYAPETSDHWDILRSPQDGSVDDRESHSPYIRPSSSSHTSGHLRRRTSQRKRPSNGSAVEALGALLLRKDSSGRVASLSFARDDDQNDTDPADFAASTSTAKRKTRTSTKHGVQAWTSALGSLGKKGLRLQLPAATKPKPSSSNGHATIAERRAHMWHQMLSRQGAVVEDSRDGFSTIRSRRGGLSFEVGTSTRKSISSRKSTPSTLLDLENYKPNGRGKEQDYEIEGQDMTPLQVNTHVQASSDIGRLPDTIVLKAGRRPRLNQGSKSEFGIGSAYHDQTLPEAPPSPVAMPGAWHGGSSWRTKPGDGYEEGALLLPPPLLDDNGSDAASFEGLLGVRRMREREKARKQAERLAARNRPAHKVGPLTALTNFVRAAHAAETSAKRANAARRFGQAPAFFRSYTEPQQLARARVGSSSSLDESKGEGTVVDDSFENSKLQSRDAGALQADHSGTTLQSARTETVSASQGAVEAELRKSPATASVSPFLSAAARRAVLSRRGSRTNSVDPSGRQLNTVFEFEPLHPSQIPDDQLASPDLPPISSPLLRPTSRGSLRTSALRDFPAAPRLLPVQLSMPPSPFTPLATDLRDSRGLMGPPLGSNGDYLSARALHSAPRTPQLGPTMLSLPPSPWTPYQDSSLVPGSPMIHLHLNTGNSSLRLPPGTPRLIPTHLEILPSPFPTSASSRRGSLTYDSPQSLRGAGLAKSPLAGATNDFTAFPALRGARSTDQLSKTAADAKAVRTSMEVAPEEKTPEKTPNKRASTNGTVRLTPSSMLVAAQSAHISDPELQDSTVVTSMDKDALNGTHLSAEKQKRRRSSQGVIHVDSSGRKRSFILWFLVGDLGLRSTKTAKSDGDDSSMEIGTDYGGLAAIFVHIFGLLVFVMAHVVDLAYLTYERVSIVLWFLRWMVLNMTGRTVLAQCVIEAYGFIQAEWATVALEDHEEKGSKKVKVDVRTKTPKGLTRWQVVRGLLELYCLHAVTRQRYLAEGAGLQKLEGWSRKKSKQDNSSKTPKQPGSDRLDIGAQRAASRAALGDKHRSRAQLDEADFHLEDAETDFDRYAEGSNAANNAAHWPTNSERSNGTFQNSQLDGGAEDEDDDSSDDEMIVTNRGDDILEFAKTPRLDAARPGQPSSGYFGRVYDFMTSPQVGASNPGSMNRDLRPFKESNRDLVRTIKWCGRLAISAYGLHVHIVDLPPTFTPSGERFSRQTFAYLSRLNADDVLHADIQTLDADADYSPTFYIVRDYVRKVVCVAVRGTQSFSDIIVDLEMQTEEIELPQVQPTPGEEFRCHAGIWRAAKALVCPQSKLFVTLRQALAENEGFGVMFCGHSLGGAIASAAALLLAEYFIPDGADQESGTWVTNMSSGLPARRPIRAVSFASPVTMTADLASRAALGSVPLVTTVVLGSDLIPRAGHGQVRELRRVLGALSRVRRRHAMASSEGQDDARVHILRSYWDWRSISMAENPDDVMLHRKERIEEQLWSLRREVESDLYAAIKARLDAESLAGARIPPSPWVGPEQRDQAPLHALAVRRQELDATTLRSEAAQGGPLIPPGRCIWINDKQIYHVQSPLAFFSLPELHSDMFAAHFPAAYEEAILELRT